MDLVQKDDEFGDTTAAVLASDVCGTESNIDVIRKHASSGVNLIVFNNDSTWKTSQLSSESDVQTQPHNHTL